LALKPYPPQNDAVAGRLIITEQNDLSKPLEVTEAFV
jgi:hypothetical protein